VRTKKRVSPSMYMSCSLPSEVPGTECLSMILLILGVRGAPWVLHPWRKPLLLMAITGGVWSKHKEAVIEEVVAVLVAIYRFGRYCPVSSPTLLQHLEGLRHLI